MKNALIIGAGKSGTSGLCFAMARAMNMRYEFEHDTGDDRNVIRKKLWGECCVLNSERYEHIFFITRDPRDRFISALLYGLTTPEVDVYKEKEYAEHFFRLLRRKEQERDFSTMKIYREAVRLNCVQRNMDPQLDWLSLEAFNKYQDLENFHLVFFDDIANGDFSAVENVIRKKLTFTVGPVSHLVYRANRSGQWRDWFTDSDVENFRGIVESWGETYGIEIDHKLEDKKIEPGVCSHWFATQINLHRRRGNLEQIEFEND